MEGTLAIIQPTPFCNIDCKYCYLPNRTASQKMSIEVLDRIFLELMRSTQVLDPIELAYHAGEPLTVGKDFYIKASDLLKSYSQRFGRTLSHYIQTNGTLIDDSWAAVFKEHSFKVGISIDGPEFIHDSNRITRSRKPTHKLVMKGIEALRKADVPFTVIMVLTKQALDYPDEIFEFFIDNGVRYVGFNIDEFGANPYTSSFYGDNEMANTVECYRKFMFRLMDLIQQAEGQLVIREFAKFASIIAQDALGEGQMTNGSNVPMYILNFDVNGNYSTFSPELLTARSPKYGDFLMGNVFHQPIDAIFDNPKYIALNEEIRRGVETCKNTCAYWEFCGGGHPADKFYESGRFDISETLNCRIHTKILADVVLEYLNSKVSSVTSL